MNIYYTLQNTSAPKKYFSAILNSGSIKITKNDSNIFSGTFYGKLVNDQNPQEIIEITEGRFDFNKNTINNFKFP